MGKSDNLTIQTYGRMENNRVASANRGLVTASSSAHFGGSNSAAKRSIIHRENNQATAAAAASSSPMMMLDSGNNLVLPQATTTTTTTSTTASGSKRPPLGRVTNSSATATTTSTTTAAAKLHSDKLATSSSALASPRRSLRSTSSTFSAAAVVTDEERLLQRNVTHQSTTTASTESDSNNGADTATAAPPSITNKKNAAILPARGGRCAVFFDKGKDVFGKCRPAAGGWYPATIQKVTSTCRSHRHSVKLHVRYDDGSLGNYSYPSNDVQILSTVNPNNNNGPNDNNNNNNNNQEGCMYGEAGQVMYHCRPTKLQAGDLVFAYFQQGQGGTSDEWFRGRVVATRRLEDFPVCDIAYDDGNLECNVPFTTGVVLKHRDGWDHPEWMVGLEVQIPPKRKIFHVTTGAPIKSGIVKEAKRHGAVWIEYDNGMDGGGGTTFSEKQAYLMVAQSLLLHAKEHLMDPKRSFQWPYNMLDTAVIIPKGHHESSLLANMINESSTQQPSPKSNKMQQRVAKKIHQQLQEVIEIDDVEDDNNNNKAAAELSPKTKMRVARTSSSTLVKTPSTTTAPVADQKPAAAQRRTSSTTSEEAMVQQQQQQSTASSKPPTGRKRAPQGQASTAQRCAPRSKATAVASSSPTIDSPTIGQGVQLDMELLNSTVECVAESDWSDSDAEGDSSQQLLLVASSSSTRPMKDIQASLGSSLVASINSTDPHLGAETLMFMAVHHKQMPGQRVRQALVALLTHGPMSGKTPFDDCHRMTLAEQYVSHCLTRPGMADNFALDAGLSYWSDCLNNLTALYYCAHGDEDRTSGFAIDRVAQTVFAKTCSASLFLKLISSQLQPFIGKNKGDKNQINREQLLTLPIVKDIAGHRRGAKEAFETCAKAYAALYITLGHFDQGHVSGLLLEEESEQDDAGPSDQSIQFVCMHSRRLLQQVGQITSILAWLYGYLANEDAKSVGRLLRNIFQRAFDDKQFDPTPFLGGSDNDKVVSVDKHWSLVKLRLILNLDKRAIPGVRPMLAETLGVGLQYNAIFG